jgi:hypothetical protein
MTSTSGWQTLRVNTQEAGVASASFAPGATNQLLLGWGFLSYYPRGGFGGDLYAVIAGKGAPSNDELKVLERYLATTAGFNL